jgi:hypothetical protein
MTRAREPGDYGWIGGHAHEIALPLTRRGAPAPTEMAQRLVPSPTAGHCQMPLAACSTWLSAKLFTARDAMDEIIGRHLPARIASLGTDEVWFIRYATARRPTTCVCGSPPGTAWRSTAPPR